ncbi:MAG: helix-turn-helix domain-containing protein, partial [Bacillota bacterium]
MTKRRKTTFEERVKIFKYCIEHDKNYSQAVEKYRVSYQQVYSWVTKHAELSI